MEVAFIDLAGTNGAVQPLTELVTHARGTGWQVLASELRIAIANPHAQVHVVFFGRVLAQTHEEVTGDVTLFANHLQVGAAQGQTAAIVVPEQLGACRTVAPHVWKQLIEVQAKVLAGQSPVAVGEIATDTAAGILYRRDAMPGTDADLRQVQRILQTIGIRALRAITQLDIAQHALRLQGMQRLGRLLGQRCQGTHHRAEWRQIEAVGVQRPLLLAPCCGALLLQRQLNRAPASFAQAQGQGVKQQVEACGCAGKECRQHEVLHLHRFALGIPPRQLWCVQLGHGTLNLTVTPVQPNLATGLQFFQAPGLRQAFRQPARPVALRQTEVQLGLAGWPVRGLQTSAQTQGQWLTIGQQQTGIDALALHAAAQGQVGIGETQGRLLEGFERQLAVQQRQRADAPQRL